MEASRPARLTLYNLLKDKLCSFTTEHIENGVMLYCLSEYGCDITDYNTPEAAHVMDILKTFGLSTDLETIIEFFESLLEENKKNENGIIFTPLYIAEYIVKNVISESDSYIAPLSIIDPGCGCGIFLVAAAEYLLLFSDKPIDYIIENNIYGIDIEQDNVRHCILVLKLLSAKHGGRYTDLKPNIICRDSLTANWTKEFEIDCFSFIIGNPPYVNPHDMSKKSINFLKKTFSTTHSGTFNIFYAFIEKAMLYLDENGALGYIVPNNFLTIKSAVELRKFLQTYGYVNKILDFGNNMIFKPTRTYNCILLLSKQRHSNFDYYIMPKTSDIEASLNDVSFNTMSYEVLDKHGWKLVDAKTYQNIRKIESQSIPIKGFIRTGIATLKDNVYLINHDEKGFYKTIKKQKLYIEDALVKPIYKIPDLKSYNNIEHATRYIIFPYIKNGTSYTLIDEAEFKTAYPNTYKCLLLQRDQLLARDKGKGAAQGWYAYGRTQGLNKYGKKLLFPTFSNSPSFTYIDNENALFCNGYAVFENDQYELDILQRVLNSRLMNYYVANTSYSIEGDYYCYQKKYIERFSLPQFTRNDVHIIRTLPKDELDDYLWSLYGLE